MSPTNSSPKKTVAVTQDKIAVTQDDNTPGIDDGATVDQFIYENHEGHRRAVNTLKKDKERAEVRLKSIQVMEGMLAPFFYLVYCSLINLFHLVILTFSSLFYCLQWNYTSP